MLEKDLFRCATYPSTRGRDEGEGAADKILDEDVEGETRTSSEPQLVLADWKATFVPSADMAGKELLSLPWTPVAETETNVVTSVARSLTKTSRSFVSEGTRLSPADMKATRPPSAERGGCPLPPHPPGPSPTPSVDVEARVS